MREADKSHSRFISFVVHPKKGLLNPEEKGMVIMSYKHDIVGTHRIPVLLKIDGGKEILVS